MRDMPSERCDPGSVTIGRNTFIVGGFGNKTIDMYNKSTKSFQTVNTMKTTRSQFGICAIKGEILISGGISNGTILKTCILYKPYSNTFKPIASINVEKIGHALVSMNDKFVFSIGGYNDKNKYLNSIEKYDLETDVWTIVDNKLNVARMYHQAVAYKHYVYVFGGSTRNNCVLNSIEKINTVNVTTTLIETKLKIGRKLFTLAIKDNSAYILGGITSDLITTDTVEIFNMENETITHGINIPFADYSFSACIL